MRAAELFRLLEEFGFTVETATGGGSHFKIKKAGHRTVPIALHNGLREDVSDLALKKLARQLQLAPDSLGVGNPKAKKRVATTGDIPIVQEPPVQEAEATAATPEASGPRMSAGAEDSAPMSDPDE